MTATEARPSGNHRRHRWWLLPPLALGAALFAMQLFGPRGPETPAAPERVVAVEFMSIAPVTVTPRATGYGMVEPAHTFRATAEVAGRIVERHPHLERGRRLPAGTLVAVIDRSEYEWGRDRALAEIDRLEAEIRQLQVRRANLDRSLAIGLRAEELARAELERQQALERRGNTSAAVVDQTESALLTQRDLVQNVRANLDEIEPEIDIRRADLAVRRTELAAAELDLERTELRLPFDARVAEVDVEQGEYVQRGEVLASFDGVSRVEVDAQFALSQMQPLLSAEVRTAALDFVAFGNLAQRLGLEATIRLRERGVDLSWAGSVDRTSGQVDAETRTYGVIVAVDDPFSGVQPGVRPPLTRGMFVEVTIEGRPLPDRLVVPANAVRAPDTAPSVLIVGADDRLERRPVTIEAWLDDRAVIGNGLEIGDRIVLSDLQPAVVGMRLRPSLRPAPWATTVSEAPGDRVP